MRRVLFLIILSSSLLFSQSIDKSIRVGYESIKATDLKTHLEILTSDSLEGRETTFTGQKKAANYIANHFTKLKLDAIGDNSSYFQHFDVEVTKVNPKTAVEIEWTNSKKKFAWKEHLIAETAKDTVVSGQVAFVGFTDTELDSTSSAKLEGRIIFVFIGKKSITSDTSKAATLRRLFAIRRDAGTVASLMIPDENGPATFHNAKKIISGFGIDNGIMKLPGSISRFRANFVRLIITPELAEETLKNSGVTLSQIKQAALQDSPFKPLFLDNVKIKITSKLDIEIKQTENVVGFLHGTDPDLKKQVLVISAHYDHIGKNEEGKIFPGADDNASGTSALLEIAEAFIKNPLKPKRSVLFIGMTGEEKGLFGSQYYVSNPLVPLNQTIANLNMDMLGRMDTTYEAMKDSNYIYIVGSDKISLELDSLLVLSNNETVKLKLDYRYNDESDPERFYYRSDHYNFAKNGVPIVFFFDGINRDYHQPTDTPDKILLNRMEKVGKLVYNLGWKLANLNRMLNKTSTRE